MGEFPDRLVHSASGPLQSMQIRLRPSHIEGQWHSAIRMHNFSLTPFMTSDTDKGQCVIAKGNNIYCFTAYKLSNKILLLLKLSCQLSTQNEFLYDSG